MSTPIQVEVISHASAWTPWLPVLGSVIVALAAFTGVFLSNRTNRAAIAAADDREHDKWWREAVLTEVAEALDTSSVLSFNFADRPARTAGLTDESLAKMGDSFESDLAKLRGNAGKLRILADELSSQVLVIASAATKAQGAAVEVQYARHEGNSDDVEKAKVVLDDAVRAFFDAEATLILMAREDLGLIGPTSQTEVQPARGEPDHPPAEPDQDAPAPAEPAPSTGA